MMKLSIDVKEPVVDGPLALYPLVSGGQSAPAYVCGPDAEATDVLVVDEIDELAAVSELVVQNRADQPVLLIEGETVLGAKQNRTLNLTVLCAPKATTTVPVSCVEQGRWGTPQTATRSPRHAPGSLRRVKTASVLASRAAGTGAGSDQGAVWDEVSAYSARLKAPSETEALEDVFEKSAADIDGIVERLRPLDGQEGVVAAIGNRVVSLDLFDKASTLATYWDGLVAGYALDALGESDAATRIADAKAFVARVAETDVASEAGVGMGTELHLNSDTISGLGLEWDGALVHLAAFAGPPEKRMSRPIRRTRRRGTE